MDDSFGSLLITPRDVSEVCHSSNAPIFVIVIRLSAILSLIEFVTLRLQTKLKSGTAELHRRALVHVWD